jgi:hypothetical protein
MLLRDVTASARNLVYRPVPRNELRNQQWVDMSQYYNGQTLHTNGSVVLDIKPKAKGNIHMTVMLVSDML